MLNLPLDAQQLWQYSIRVYAQEPVKNTCLNLQDEFGANVNIILLCMLLDNAQILLSVDDLGVLQKAISAADNKLKRMRDERKAIKRSSTAAIEDIQTQYQLALNDELEMEREQQRTLVTVFNALESKKSFKELQAKSIATAKTSPMSLENYLCLVQQTAYGRTEQDPCALLSTLQGACSTLKEYV